MRPQTLLGLAFVGVFGFFVVTSFSQNVSGYENFRQATESGRMAHVVGTWAEDHPSHYDPASNRFTFAMRDDEGTVRQVVYAAPKPANFEDAEKVVVEGRVEGDHFAADRILVKCPSKYNETNGFEEAEPGVAPTTAVSTPVIPASAR